MTDEARQHFERHALAQRRMQTGVAFDHGRGGRDGEPKHLRVGVNTALVDMASLVRLLIAKGTITEEEYAKAIADGMEAEAARYEERLGATCGPCGIGA